MTTIVAQQVALDNALVPLKKRVKIGKYNMRIDPSKTQKEATYQVVLDALALTTCYLDFLITADVPKIYMQQFWFTINKKDSTTYKFKIDKKSYKINMEVFREIFQICPRLLNKDFDELSSDDEIDSDAYKTYLAYATGEASPKMKRKLKKPASPSKKRTLITEEEEQLEPAKKDVSSKKPATKRRFVGVQIRDTPAQLKKALNRSKRDTNIYQACSSSKGVDSESEVPDEPKCKSIDTSKGTSFELGVPDVSKGDSSKSGYES
ncbi:hypothetical protein Tco_1495836 [Tanacetum coccineum]